MKCQYHKSWKPWSSSTTVLKLFMKAVPSQPIYLWSQNLKIPSWMHEWIRSRRKGRWSPSEQKLSMQRLTFYLESLSVGMGSVKMTSRFSSSPLWSLLIPKALSIPLVESLSCTKLAIYSKTRLTQWWRLAGTDKTQWVPAWLPLVVWCSSAALCHCRGQLYSYCQAPTAENTKHPWLSGQRSAT